MKQLFYLISIISIMLMLPQSDVLGQVSRTNYVLVGFPSMSESNTVKKAGNYYIYLTSTGIVTGDPVLKRENKRFLYDELLISLQLRTSDGNELIAGLMSTEQGVHWFAAVPQVASSPDIECLQGMEVWTDFNERHTACLSDRGDMGLSATNPTALRVQFVYNGDHWIVRFRNNATTAVKDVAKIYVSNSDVIFAQVALNGSCLFDCNGGFYANDFKYKRDHFWAHIPSDITDNSIQFSSNYIYATVMCPQFGVAPYIQNNPYLWYMGTFGSECSGQLYQGGGSSTEVTSIAAEYSGSPPNGVQGKFLSSENGTDCVHTNRFYDGAFEQWYVDDVDSSTQVAYRGNNHQYLSRHANNSLWQDSTDLTDADTLFFYEEQEPYVFKIKNIGNGQYVDHNKGTSCVKANAAGNNNETLFRYVAP